MPGTDHHNLEQLDYTALQNFIDTDVSGFLHALDDIRSPNAHPTSLYDVSKKPQPLAIGGMSGDDQTGGKDICANAQKAATAIDNVFSRHKDAFTKLQGDLRHVIKTMKETQAHNLTQIESTKFMDAIGDYQTALGGSSNPSTSTNSGSGNGQK